MTNELRKELIRIAIFTGVKLLGMAFIRHLIREAVNERLKEMNT